MGRKKQFVREEVLRKALKLFWEKGYADTSLSDLENATGVNKSGLYSEFNDKLDLFLEALRYYLGNRGGAALLMQEPLGLENLRRFLEIGEVCMEGCRGCFAVNSMREVGILPPEAKEIIIEGNKGLKRLMAKNIKAALPEANANELAELTLTFFSGLCIEQNLLTNGAVTRRKVNQFLRVLLSAAKG